MIAPSVHTRSGDTWIFTWAAFQIGIGVTHVEERQGAINTELTIESLWPGASGRLHWARLNLAATRTRAELARYLANLTTDPVVPWDLLLEELTAVVVEEYRSGEPVINLREVEVPDAPQRDLIYPLLPTDETTILYGPGGSLKSVIALALAVSASTGFRLPGLSAPAQAVPVLYLDWESNPVEHAERLDWLCRGMGIHPPPDIHYRQMHRPLVDDVDRVAEARTMTRAEFLAYDSLGGACDGDLNDAHVAIGLMRAMRLIGGTRLAVAHMAAVEADRRNGATTKPIGSVYFANYARSLWEARAGEETEPRILGLFHRKVNRGRLYRQPLAWEIAWNEDRRELTMARASVSDDSTVSSHATLSYRIREALRRGALPTSQIAELVDAGEPTVRRILRRLEGRPDGVQRLSNEIGGRGNEALWGISG